MNDTRVTLVDTIRQNPIPAAMVGAGLVWLLMNRSTSASKRVSESSASSSLSEDKGIGVGIRHAMHDAQDAAGNVAGQIGSAVNQAGETVSRVAHQATDAAGNIVHQASDLATSAFQSASETASHLASQTSETAMTLVHGAGNAASFVADNARKGAHKLEEGFESTMSQNPMALGAAALAVGAIVGFSLPRTQREDEVLGAARDTMIRRAGEAAHDAVASVGHFAEQTGESAKKSLKESFASTTK